jgi:alkylation response protein AidB-like acyl-CoA dehydrogenase
MRKFADEQIAPYAERIDREAEFADEVHAALCAEGLWGATVPKEYGGLGLDALSYAILIEEVGRVCGSTCLMLAAHCSLGCFPIYAFGTPEQKSRYLPRGAKGELIAFGLTEPQAGSDAGATLTRASKQDDGSWLIRGTKCWCTNATRAFAHVITARIDDSPGTSSITNFILEPAMSGFKTGKKEDKMGLRGSDTAFLHFDDLRVPDAQRLGGEGQGFKQFMTTLDGGRISIGAMAVGLAQGALDVAVRYAARKHEGGEPMAARQSIQFQLADMETQTTAARLLVVQAAVMKDRGEKFGKVSAMAKLFASEVGRFCAYTGIGILGADGCSTQYPVERFFRDVKLCEIGEGTSEIQRLVISRELLRHSDRP